MKVIEKTQATVQMKSPVWSNASQVFPWLKYLSPDEIETFYGDFFNALEQALHDKNWDHFEETIESWQATADVLADSKLTAILTAPLSDDDLEEWNDVEAELFNKDK